MFASKNFESIFPDLSLIHIANQPKTSNQISK